MPGLGRISKRRHVVPKVLRHFRGNGQAIFHTDSGDVEVLDADDALGDYDPGFTELAPLPVNDNTHLGAL